MVVAVPICKGHPWLEELCEGQKKMLPLLFQSQYTRGTVCSRAPPNNMVSLGKRGRYLPSKPHEKGTTHLPLVYRDAAQYWCRRIRRV